MEIVAGYRPGVLAGLVARHMDYYGPVWGFGAAFETKLAAEAAAFLRGYDPARDLLLSVWASGGVAATVALDGSERDGPGDHLRWFVVGRAAAGRGLGARLLDRALAFSDARGAGLVWLTTFRGLDRAAALYAARGFVCVAEAAEDQWQGGVREQRWERR